jgi:hypothetical protein
MQLTVDQAKILAVECWRLERASAAEDAHGIAASIRYATRRIQRVLQELNLSIIDPKDQPYDPGLAVQVVETLAGGDATQALGVICEVVEPMVLLNGAVVGAAKVVVRAPQSDQGRCCDSTGEMAE